MMRGSMVDRGCVDYGSDMVYNRGNMVYNRCVVDDRGVVVLMAVWLLMVDFVADEGLGGGCVSVAMGIVLGAHRHQRSREDYYLLY